MLTISLLLVLLAGALVVYSITGRVPLWPAVLVLVLERLVNLLPLR